MKLYFYIFKIKTYIFFFRMYVIRYYGRFSKAIHNSVDIQYFRAIATSRTANSTVDNATQTDPYQEGEQRKQDKGVTPESKGISLDQSWLAV